MNFPRKYIKNIFLFFVNFLIFSLFSVIFILFFVFIIFLVCGCTFHDSRHGDSFFRGQSSEAVWLRGRARETDVGARARVVSFLTARRAGLEMLLDPDDLGLLEDVHASSETIEAIVHRLGGGEHPCEITHPHHVRLHRSLGDLLGHQCGENRTQLGTGTHLGSWRTKRARSLVVTGAHAGRADHVVRLFGCEKRELFGSLKVWLLFDEKTLFSHYQIYEQPTKKT